MEEHPRSQDVLEPLYVADLDHRSLDELRVMRAECADIENAVSYVRRIAQARIDILEAEADRRARGGSLEELIRALPRILADSGPRAAPASSRLALPLAPGQESEWAPRLAAIEAAVADLPSLDDDRLQSVLGELRSLEHEVSAQRHGLHGVLDQVDAALARRLAAESV